MMEKQMLRMERLSSNLEDSDLHFHDRSALKPIWRRWVSFSRPLGGREARRRRNRGQAVTCRERSNTP